MSFPVLVCACEVCVALLALLFGHNVFFFSASQGFLLLFFFFFCFFAFPLLVAGVMSKREAF